MQGTVVTSYKPIVASWSFLTLDYRLTRSIGTAVTGYKPTVDSWSFLTLDYRLTRGIGTAVTGYKPTVDSLSFLTLDMQVNTPARGVWTIVTGYKPPVASWLKKTKKQKTIFFLTLDCRGLRLQMCVNNREQPAKP